MGFSLAVGLQNVIGRKRVLGPEESLIPRIKGKFIWEILIKLEKEGVNFKKAKELISEQIKVTSMQKEFSKGMIVVDVDPI